MVARATAPDRIGPGSAFPDASKWDFNQGLKGTAQLQRREHGSVRVADASVSRSNLFVIYLHAGHTQSVDAALWVVWGLRGGL
jgi:hypothetical protein